MYIGMLYSLCILQGYKMSLILNITPKVISEKKSCEIKLDFKNHRDKLWNTTGLIGFLVYFTTWQTSYPSPLPQKTSCENEARDKDSSLMQFRGKGKARNFFGKPSQPQSSVGLPCFMDSILLPGKAGVQREISALLCSAATWENGGHLLLPIATACSLQQLIVHPAQFSAWRVGLADSASIEKVIDQNELRNTYNYYMMTPKSLRRRKKGFQKQGQRGRW